MSRAFLAVLALLSLPAAAASAGAPGSAGAQFLEFGQGARAVAMGESQVAVADDAYAAYWNPAGLASLLYPTAAVTYNHALEGVDQQYLSLAYPLGRGSTLDLNLTRLGVSSMQGYDAQGVRTGQVGASDYAVGAAYGLTLLRDGRGRALLNGGAAVKGIREQLGDVSAQSYGLDAGALLYLWRAEAAAGPDAGLRLGLCARNLGPGLRFDAGQTPLPSVLTAGLAWRGYPRGDPFTASADVVESRDAGAYGALGLEYTAFRLLALRMGFRTEQGAGVGFRAGVGFMLKTVELDYAFAGFGDLGQMHRVGLSVRLGGPVETTPPEQLMVGREMERGEQLMREGRYYEAVLHRTSPSQFLPGGRAGRRPPKERRR